MHSPSLVMREFATDYLKINMYQMVKVEKRRILDTIFPFSAIFQKYLLVISIKKKVAK